MGVGDPGSFTRTIAGLALGGRRHRALKPRGELISSWGSRVPWPSPQETVKRTVLGKLSPAESVFPREGRSQEEKEGRSYFPVLRNAGCWAAAWMLIVEVRRVGPGAEITADHPADSALPDLSTSEERKRKVRSKKEVTAVYLITRAP